MDNSNIPNQLISEATQWIRLTAVEVSRADAQRLLPTWPLYHLLCVEDRVAVLQRFPETRTTLPTHTAPRRRPAQLLERTDVDPSAPEPAEPPGLAQHIGDPSLTGNNTEWAELPPTGQEQRELSPACNDGHHIDCEGEHEPDTNGCGCLCHADPDAVLQRCIEDIRVCLQQHGLRGEGLGHALEVAWNGLLAVQLNTLAREWSRTD